MAETTKDRYALFEAAHQVGVSATDAQLLLHIVRYCRRAAEGEQP